MNDDEIYSQFVSLYKDIIRESWMDEEDLNEVMAETFKQGGITKENLVADIRTGISNGYSIEFQLNLLKTKILQQS